MDVKMAPTVKWMPILPSKDSASLLKPPTSLAGRSGARPGDSPCYGNTLLSLFWGQVNLKKSKSHWIHCDF